jgi:hypothetical protein
LGRSRFGGSSMREGVAGQVSPCPSRRYGAGDMRHEPRESTQRSPPEQECPRDRQGSAGPDSASSGASTDAPLPPYQCRTCNTPTQRARPPDRTCSPSATASRQVPVVTHLLLAVIGPEVRRDLAEQDVRSRARQPRLRHHLFLGSRWRHGGRVATRDGTTPLSPSSTRNSWLCVAWSHSSRHRDGHDGLRRRPAPKADRSASRAQADHPLRAAVELRWNCFRQGRNLGNTHGTFLL